MIKLTKVLSQQLFLESSGAIQREFQVGAGVGVGIVAKVWKTASFKNCSKKLWGRFHCQLLTSTIALSLSVLIPSCLKTLHWLDIGKLKYITNRRGFLFCSWRFRLGFLKIREEGDLLLMSWLTMLIRGELGGWWNSHNSMYAFKGRITIPQIVVSVLLCSRVVNINFSFPHS